MARRNPASAYAAAIVVAMRTKQSAGAILAALRWSVIQTYPCSLCGRQFESGRRAGPRYCSRACQQRAYRQRHIA